MEEICQVLKWLKYIVLVQCNLVNNQHQQKSEVLNTLTANISYVYLLNL